MATCLLSSILYAATLDLEIELILRDVGDGC